MSGEEETSEEKETSEKETTKENEKETTEKLDEGDEVIRVTSPDGASVYFDGVYKGVAPVEFKKQAGEHVIILRMDGYENMNFRSALQKGGSLSCRKICDMAFRSFLHMPVHTLPQGTDRYIRQ